MSVCPFCKNAVPNSVGSCPTCGREPGDHPSVQGMGGHTIESGWGDDDLSGGLDISRGGSMASEQSGPSAYAGGGVSFGDDDDPFADDAPQGALELDLPSHHTANSPRSIPSSSGANTPSGNPPRSIPAGNAPPAPPGSVPDLVLPGKPPSTSLPVPPRSDPSLPPRSEPQQQQQVHAPPPPPAPAPPPPPDPAGMIARYPDPPAKFWEAPLYTMKVLLRQFELRQDLASLRKKRSPDVGLYERALKTHDAKAFALGLAITCAGLVFASFIFFLPVILRFLRDPD